MVDILRAEGDAVVKKYIDLCVACVLNESLEAFGGDDWSAGAKIEMMKTLETNAAVQDIGYGHRMRLKRKGVASVYRRFYLNPDTEEILDY